MKCKICKKELEQLFDKTGYYCSNDKCPERPIFCNRCGYLSNAGEWYLYAKKHKLKFPHCPKDGNSGWSITNSTPEHIYNIILDRWKRERLFKRMTKNRRKIK